MHTYRAWLTRLPRWLQRRIDYGDAEVRRFIREAAHRVPAGSLVLDVGAGESRWRDGFEHAHYVALDFGLGDPTWDYSALDLVADAQALPIESCRVDAVVCTHVLEHVTDPQCVISEMARVLKPGGVLYLTVPQNAGEHQRPHDYFRFTSYALQLMLARAGLDVVSVEPLGGFFVYLGTQIAFVPKYLFSGVRTRAGRWALRPVEIAAVVLLGGLIPAICYSLDPLDKRRDLTLGYAAVARRRPVVAPGQAK